MADAGFSSKTIMGQLDRISRATARAQLGQSLFAVINAHNDVVTRFNAFLAHVDTANATGIGNGNVAAYGAPATDTVGLPGTYPSKVG